MKKTARITAVLYCFAILVFLIGTGFAVRATESPIDPCLNCHTGKTAGIVEQWEAIGIADCFASGTIQAMNRSSEWGNVRILNERLIWTDSESLVLVHALLKFRRRRDV